jgi:hypothetical protein
VAWVEAETWPLEQGLDGKITFELFSNTAQTQAWQFPGWDVNSVICDAKQRTILPVLSIVNALAGTVEVIITEAMVNALRPGKPYYLNTLMVAPGNLQADDHHLAFLPVTVAARPARRDP